MEGEIFPIAPNVDGMRGHVVARCDATKASGGFDFHGAHWAATEMARRTGETFVVWTIRPANAAKGRGALAQAPTVYDAERANDDFTKRAHPRPEKDKGIPMAARRYFGPAS